MKHLNIVLLSVMITAMLGCAKNSQLTEDIVIENEDMRLVISPYGIAKSLIHKPTNEESLMPDVQVPVFSLVFDMNYDPYDDLYKANVVTMGEHVFNVDTIFRKGNQLIAHFDIVNIYLTIELDIKPKYIQFSVKDFVFSDKKPTHFGHGIPQIDEIWFLQLPVRDRTHFGNWLNVMWDDDIAVNLLAADPYARITSEERYGFRILKAGSISKVKLNGVGACLITTATNNLLDNIAQVEEDYNLPQGVRNRRCEQSDLSTYLTDDIHPGNVDKHIEYAQQAGFRTFCIYYPAFAKHAGHFEWKETYPNGMKDLQTVVKKIDSAGMVPGVHLHYNKTDRNDKYVTPVPDHRLRIRRHFTLNASLGKTDTTVFVEENPSGVMLDDERRILKIGDELISYSDYSTTRPYKFTGCERGILNTTRESYRLGTILGLLHVDSWPKFILFDQNTSIQEEVAERLAEICNNAGFKFIHFDGGEDVHHPHWFNCSKAQWEVYRRTNPELIFASGAMFSHFSWHMLSRGNQNDAHLWPGEEMKESIIKYPAHEAPLMADNFTASTFGRYRYFIPGKNTIGHQPDMWEYLTSRAAGWDAPYVLLGNLKNFDAHPRTSDNLEVIKRWEDVRVQNWLTEKQKLMLRDLKQEHILLINEQKEFELVPYKQILEVAKGNEVRAFIFERKDGLYVVYWHVSGNSQLDLPLNKENITLFEEFGKEAMVLSGENDNSVTLPVSHRRYIRTSKLSKEQVINAFRDAIILN